MQIGFRKFQEGGAVPAPEEQQSAQPQQGGGDPVMQLAQMAAQALQSQDCNTAMQVCQAFVQMIQQSQGGAAPAPEESEPVYRAGGRLVRRIKK